MNKNLNKSVKSYKSSKTTNIYTQLRIKDTRKIKIVLNALNIGQEKSNKDAT
jgi:hypothetical protein